jgi:3D (Asp-Asp-Asp) domain-containing protein
VSVRTAVFLASLGLLLLVPIRASAHPAAGRSPQPAVHRAAFRMTATAYCNRGTTRSGVRTRGGIVAADPRRLPLGTTVQIAERGKLYAGRYTVMDTGHAVKGRVLDIFMPSCESARKFGRRIVQVRVLR